MPKRIALFILGVVLAVGAFLLYQTISGTGTGGVKRPKGTLPPPPTTSQFVYEERDPTGRLMYYITAPRAPQPIKDAAGNTVPGQFRVETPDVRFYDKTGRMVRLQADLCDVALAQVPGAGGGPPGPGTGGLGAMPIPGAGKNAIRPDQISGSMSGHVRMEVGAKPGAADKGDKDPFAGGVRIYFDGPVALDGASQQVKSDEGLHIRSETIEADQQGLSASFDQKSQQLISLRIGENPRGNQVIVRNQGDKAMNMLSGGKDKTAGGGNALAVAPAATATGPAKEKKPVPTYRLLFGQDVLARSGDRSLAAQNLSVIFSPTPELRGEDASTKPAAASAPAPLLDAGAPLPIPETPEPIKPAGPKDLVITWAGPLELLETDPAEVKLSAPDEIILDATGTAQKPVTVRGDPGAKGNGFEALAGRLKYQTRQPTLLIPDAYGKVVLRGITSIAAATTPGTATAPAGTKRFNEVTCGETMLTMEEKQILARLQGPGTLTDRQTEKDGVEVTSVTRWKTMMDLVLVPDPNDPKGQDFAIHSARFDGAQITRNGAKGLDFAADLLEVMLANVKGEKDPQLDHLLATGNVNFLRHGARPDDNGGLTTDRLEISSQTPAPGAAPVLSALTADGKVSAWRYTDKSRSFGLPGMAASAPAVAPATQLALLDDGRLDLATCTKEVIAADKLAAELMPRPKSAPATAPATQPGGVFGDFGGNVDVKHVVAQDHVHLQTIPPAKSDKPGFEALAAELDYDQTKLESVITGGLKPDGTPAMVQVTYGPHQMEGQRIQVDQNKDNTYNITVPGPGSFAGIMPATPKRPKPTPLTITWADRMNYDGTNQMIVFNGKPMARSPGKNEDQAFLSCEDTLTVKLKKKEPAAATASAPAGTQAATKPADEDKFDVDWLQAVGNVDARGAEYDDANKLLARVRLSAPGSVKYFAENDAIDIPGPGFMVIEDNRPDKPGAAGAQKMSTAGETDFLWKGSLVRDDKGLITISREVTFLFRPTKPLKFGSAPAGAPAGKTYLRLDTDALVATPNAKDPKARAAPGPMNVGVEGVSKVVASGNPVLEMGNYQMVNGAFKPEPNFVVNGEKIDVDMPAKATITGSTEDGVIVRKVTSGEKLTGTQIQVDMTTDKVGVTIRDARGNISGF